MPRRPFERQRRVMGPTPAFPSVSLSVPTIAPPIPRATFDVAGANAALEFGQLIGALGQRLTRATSDAADEVAAEQGAREGLRQGALGEFERRSSLTIRGQAFNKAALATYGDQVNLQMRRQLGEFAERHPADPGLFRQQARAWWEGFQAELPDELRGRAELTFSGLEDNYVAAAKDRLNKQVADESAATFVEMRERLGVDIDNAGRTLWVGSPEASEAALRVLMDADATLAERLSPVGVDGLPVFPEKFQAEQRIALGERTLVSVARGFVDAADNKFAALEALQEDGISLNLGEGTVNLREVMPRELWEQTLGYARSRAVEQRQDQRRGAEGDVRARTMEAFRIRVAVEQGDPSVTLGDITAGVQSGLFSDGEGASLVKTMEKRETELVERIEDAERFNQSMQAAVPLDPKNKRDQKAVDDGYEAFLNVSGIEDPFSNEGLAVVAEIAKRTTLVPDRALSSIRVLSRSGSPGRAAQAAELVARLEEVAPQSLTELSTEEKAFSLEVNEAVRAGVPAEEAVELVRNRVFTPRSSERKALEQAAREMRKGNPNVLDGFLNRDFDPSLFAFPPRANPELTGDFNAAAELYLEKTGNPDSARRAAWNDLKRVWGMSEVNGQREMMKFAPEVVFPGGQAGWIREQLVADLESMGLDPAKHVIGSDPVTARRRPPDYQILEVDEFGVQRPVINEEGELLRFRPNWETSPAAARTEQGRQEAVLRARQIREGTLEAEANRFKGPELTPAEPTRTPTPGPAPGSAF